MMIQVSGTAPMAMNNEFDDAGLMRRREASNNDASPKRSANSDGPGPRPADHPASPDWGSETLWRVLADLEQVIVVLAEVFPRIRPFRRKLSHNDSLN
jgi:hypothetical protein